MKKSKHSNKSKQKQNNTSKEKEEFEYLPDITFEEYFKTIDKKEHFKRKNKDF